MTEHLNLPAYDDNGLNLVDPKDRLGYKTKYISLVQEAALKKYIGRGVGDALDIGCGYGRMSEAIADLGYTITGVDPSERILNIAAENKSQHTWVVGGLPDLPFSNESFDLVCLLNIARALHLMNIADVCTAVPRYVKLGGRLIVLDNLRKNDKRYLPEEWFEETFAREGLVLKDKVAIRSSRWFMIYLIRYGFIPISWFSTIAKWELKRMSKKVKSPKHSYYNFIFIFEKNL